MHEGWWVVLVIAAPSFIFLVLNAWAMTRPAYKNRKIF